MGKDLNEMKKILSELKEELKPIIKEYEEKTGTSFGKLTIDMVNEPCFVGFEVEENGVHFYI